MRFTIPRARRSLVPRVRLYDALGDGTTHRLITITAPAGFGKSSLVADWLHTLPAGPPVTWWNLSGADDSPTEFVRAIAEVLSRHVPGIAPIATAVSHGDVPPENAFALVIDALARHDHPRMLVLDDLHLLRSEALHVLLHRLIDEGPPHLHLVFISRTPPPFSLMRLRLAGDLLELTSRDLAFDHDEFDAFIRSGPLAHASPAHLAAIERRTEGWPAGLQLFALAAAQHSSKDDAAAADAFLTEYLHEEVLRLLPHPLADALLRSAFLPVLDAAGLSSVLNIDHAAAQELLRKMLQIGLPAQTFDRQNNARTIRLHPLVRDYLLAHMPTQFTADEIAGLCVRSAAALSAAGDVDAALALLADDAFSAARMLAAHSRPALLRSDIAALQRWLRTLPAEALCSQPQLAMDYAWLALAATDEDLAERHAVASTIVAACSVDFPAAAHSEWQAELHVLEACIAQQEWNFDRARSAMQRAAHTPHDPRGLAEAYRLSKSVFMPPHSPPLAEQIHMLQNAGAIFHELKDEYSSIECRIAHGLLLWRSFDLPRALIVFNEAVAIVAESNLEFSASAAELYCYRGESFFLMDRRDEARADFERVVQLHAALGDNVVIVDWARVHFQECRILENPSASTTVLDDGATDWAMVRHKSPHWIVARSAWLRVRRELRLGRPLHARRIAASLGTSLEELTPEMPETHWLALILSEIYLSENPEKIFGPLLRLQDIAQQREWAWLKIYVQVLTVVLHMRIGHTEEARSALRLLLPRIEEAHAPRMILDFPELAGLLAVEGSLDAQSLLQRMPHTAATPFNLSTRELEILRRFVAGRSPKEIADELSITVGTLYGHRHKIYQRMGVHSRAHAVKAARAVGIGGE